MDTVIPGHFSQGREEEEEEIQNALTLKLGLKFNESRQIRVREWHWKILNSNAWDLIVKVIYLLTHNTIWLHNAVLIQRWKHTCPHLSTDWWSFPIKQQLCYLVRPEVLHQTWDIYSCLMNAGRWKGTLTKHPPLRESFTLTRIWERNSVQNLRPVL